MVLSKSFLIAILVLFFLWILVVIKSFRAKERHLLFWFCEMSPLLIIVAMLFNNIQFIKGIINFALLPQFFSVILACMVLFFNFKNTNFQNVKTKGPFYATAFFLLHLVSVNLALAVTIHTRATPISWLYSLGVMIFVFVVTYLFTDHKLNINFIREFEFVKLKPSIYWIAWFIVAFIVLVIPTYFLQNWIGSLFA